MTNRLALPFLFLGAVLLAGCGAADNVPELLFGGWQSVCGLIHLVLVVLAYVKLANSAADTGSKLLWGALIFFFPVVGLLAWWVWGPKG